MTLPIDPASVKIGARGSNQSGMRAHNERLVLSLIRQAGAMAKAEIARLTGLSAQTVSVIMRALEAEGLLQKGEPVRGRVGQPSTPISLNPDGAFFLGLKVGRRSLDLILIDFMGRERRRASLNHRYPTPDSVVRFANTSIKEMLGNLSDSERGRVAGLGIAIPFQLWDWAPALGVNNLDMEEWRRRDIAQELASTWDFPVYLQNDASAACGAELVFGRKDNPPDFLHFFIGYFIGGGLVLDNRLYTGRTGNAAAIGSMPIRKRSGEIGQLIDVASLATLESALNDAGQDGNLIWTHGTHWDIPESLLEQWLDQAAQALGQAIVAASSVIDVQTVILDGWMPKVVLAELIERTESAMAALPQAGITTPGLRAGSIGPEARAFGAASLPLSARFLVDLQATQNT